MNSLITGQCVFQFAPKFLIDRPVEMVTFESTVFDKSNVHALTARSRFFMNMSLDLRIDGHSIEEESSCEAEAVDCGISGFQQLRHRS